MKPVKYEMSKDDFHELLNPHGSDETSVVIKVFYLAI